MDNSKKTIVFDFGNVLIDLDFETCFQNFEKILKVDWSERVLPQFLKDAIYLYDKGEMENDEFVESFLQLNPKAKYDDVVYCWNSLVENLPTGRLVMLQELKQKYNVVLLSNINPLHLDAIHNYLMDEFDIQDFEDRFFDKVFYSHLIGKRKPDAEIYDFVVSELNVDPRHVVFIDDLRENVKAAKSAGWNAVHHKSGDEIISMLPVYLRMVGFE